MSECTKKEPGRADVTELDRGDPRQQGPVPKAKQEPARSPGPDDGPPEANRNPSSPWLGGG